MHIPKEKIKLIAADLDGTLLNSNKEISEYNQKIIKKLINEYNIDFVLSSGRPYEGIKNYNKILENNNLSIIFNGASIADNNGKIIFQKTIEEEASKQIIELSKKYDVCMHVYNNGKYIISKENFPIKSYVQREKTVNVVVGLENTDDYNFDKILILGQRDILEKLKKEIDSLDSVHTCFSGELFLEAVNKEVNKGNALKQICKMKKIDIKDTIAFGDNFNDIEMIEYSGIGVAMGNAEETVKQRADYITLSNEEDGVGKFLSDLFC